MRPLNSLAHQTLTQEGPNTVPARDLSQGLWYLALVCWSDPLGQALSHGRKVYLQSRKVREEMRALSITKKQRMQVIMLRLERLEGEIAEVEMQ